MKNIYSKIRIYLLTFLNICLSELLTSLLLEPATLRVTKMWRYFYFQLRWQREPNIRNLNLLFCIFCQSGLVSQINIEHGLLRPEVILKFRDKSIIRAKNLAKKLKVSERDIFILLLCIILFSSWVVSYLTWLSKPNCVWCWLETD